MSRFVIHTNKSDRDRAGKLWTTFQSAHCETLELRSNWAMRCDTLSDHFLWPLKQYLQRKDAGIWKKVLCLPADSTGLQNLGHCHSALYEFREIEKASRPLGGRC